MDAPDKSVLIRELMKLKSERACLEFLDTLLTEREWIEFVQRLSILRLLEEGKTQRAIAAELGVSIATVSRGALAYKQRKNP